MTDFCEKSYLPFWSGVLILDISTDRSHLGFFPEVPTCYPTHRVLFSYVSPFPVFRRHLANHCSSRFNLILLVCLLSNRACGDPKHTTIVCIEVNYRFSYGGFDRAAFLKTQLLEFRDFTRDLTNRNEISNFRVSGKGITST